jgi:hypothetical protein
MRVQNAYSAWKDLPVKSRTERNCGIKRAVQSSRRLVDCAANSYPHLEKKLLIIGHCGDHLDAMKTN